MKKILMTLTFLAGATAFADISSFLGQYTLTAKNEVAEVGCFNDIVISEKSGMIDLSDLYSPTTGNIFDGSPVRTSQLVLAPLNGPERVHDGDHDVLSKTKHYDKVTLSNNVLTIKTKYTERAMGIPLALVSYTSTFSLPDAAGIMKSKRTEQVNLSSKTSQCVYKKIK